MVEAGSSVQALLFHQNPSASPTLLMSSTLKTTRHEALGKVGMKERNEDGAHMGRSG